MDDHATAPSDVEDLEDLFENAPCGYISARADGRISKANQTFATWTGYQRDQLVGRRLPDLLNIAGKIYHETHFAPLLRMQGFFNEVALDVVRSDGAILPVLINAVERRDSAGDLRFIRMTIFNASDRRRYERDLLAARKAADRANAELHELNLTLEARVSETVQQRLKVEEAFRQSQKMEAVGQLTGGLAHDFNNLLATVSGSLELLQIRLRQGRASDAERYILAAQAASARAAALTHRLLAFSRRQTLDPRPTDINRLVTGMGDLIRGTTGPAVAVEVVASTGLWTTLVDPNQLENALLNLCINARDAMPDGGRLTIRTSNCALDETAARECNLSAGQYAVLCVSDTGTGMPPEVVAQAFDPFFTTKPTGMGTGLGLSMVYGFVSQSGGHIQIHSEVGRGTKLCLYLPRHHGQDGGSGPPPDPPEPMSDGQGETVLVVDDEPAVRMLVTDILQDLGYVSVEAADGLAGLEILRSDRRIALVITDVGLPGGMNGRQMVDAARVARPGLQVLFITGYAETAAIGGGDLDPGMHVLTKPFAMKVLANTITRLVAGD